MAFDALCRALAGPIERERRLVEAGEALVMKAVIEEWKWMAGAFGHPTDPKDCDGPASECFVCQHRAELEKQLREARHD